MIKIMEYDLKGMLPNPFIFDDGTKVISKSDWDKRRKEIYETAVELQYGGMPPAPEVLRVEPLYLGGKGNINTYKITTGKKDKNFSFNMLVFKAEDHAALPTVISGDLCFPYAFNKEYIEAFTNNKINLVLFNRTDLFPDIAQYNVKRFTEEGTNDHTDALESITDFENGKRRGILAEIYQEYSFGAISAWAWGYSRCVDALAYLGIADMECIAFTGHSRGAKTAILAGALDERAVIVNPNAACAGGCSCYRLHIKAIKEDGVSEAESEPISNIFKHFPLWMGQGLREYIDREEELPFDSHYLKALVAPRILLVTEAASDIMANPVGSWQTSEAAKEVYKFLGVEENLLWSFREGDHYHAIEDIKQLINVIKHYKWGEPLNDNYFKAPFEMPPLAFDWRVKRFFVGIDSDGTAFDSMTIKHSDAFIPTMIKVWKLEAHAAEVVEINERINLYSQTRGVNRFIGLKMAFDCMKEQGIPVPNYAALTRFVEAKVGLSNDALRKYMQEDNSEFLKEVLSWSEEADIIFAEKTEGLEPFTYVREALRKMSEYANVVVISSASRASLYKDWIGVGLDKQVTQILGQEAGTKKEQLAASAAGSYAEENILMIGDALGDYEAVQKVNGLFYPIIPGKECECWKRLLEEGLERFFHEEYKGVYQDKLLKEFLDFLK